IEDSLNVRDKKETALELATIYKLQEKEWNIRQKDEQLHNSFIVQVLLGCAFVLALISLWLAIRHMNIIRKKNILMANKLDSLMSYEREIDRLHRQIAVIEESDQENSLNKSLFKKMERLIKDEKLYLIPELSRQDMLERLSIDKNRFGQMLQENTNMTFSQYLTEIRLKHALTELKIHPNYTIQAISEESGFANTRNFQRLFKAAFDMTPSDYKKIVQEKQHREPPMD
ncbi:helix-turn-helix domain-containing protein, partial [Bacteroides cellulosilyticus]|uniref:helix-turn-helix domain-containing protein n=2 Tax=Bacteroides TaxID=816 RepID=UPI0018AA8887